MVFVADVINPLISKLCYMEVFTIEESKLIVNEASNSLGLVHLYKNIKS